MQVDRPEDRETVRELEHALPPVSPPPRTREGVRVAARAAERRSRRRRASVAATLTAVAAACVAAFAVALRGDREPTVDRRAAIAALAPYTVEGEALLVRSDTSDASLLLTLRGLPPAPPGHHYAVWILRRGTSEMEAIGTFTPASRVVRLELALPGSGDYVAVDVSIEPNAGDPAHSGKSVAGATLT